MLRLKTDLLTVFTEAAMIASVSQVFAGHAGEAGLPLAIPHEVLGGMALLVAIGIILIVIGAMAVCSSRLNGIYETE